MTYDEQIDCYAIIIVAYTYIQKYPTNQTHTYDKINYKYICKLYNVYKVYNETYLYHYQNIG